MAVKSADPQDFRHTLSVCWSEYDALMQLLMDKIAQDPRQFKHVHGVPRGGLVAAVHLSHLLGIPLAITTIGLNPREVLVVDDVSDTGKALYKYKQAGFATATLHMKTGTKVVPDFFVHEHASDTWIVYPWEGQNIQSSFAKGGHHV